MVLGPNVSLGWALDSSGFVAYKEAGGLGGLRPPIYRNMGGKKPPTKNPKSQKAVMLGCY